MKYWSKDLVSCHFFANPLFSFHFQPPHYHANTVQRAQTLLAYTLLLHQIHTEKAGKAINQISERAVS